MGAMKACLMVVILSICGVAMSQTLGPGGMAEFRERARSRTRGFYMGIGAGPTQLSTADNAREMDGLSFRFDTDDDDLGAYFILGGWITDNVGLEVGSRVYGTVDVPFEFDDPLDGTSGTGESEVSIDGFNVSLVLGMDVPKTPLQFYARVGALWWTESFESRFYIPGQPAIERKTEDDGVGVLYGAGIGWRFASTWQLNLQYEMSALDDDDISMASLALSYDFIGMMR